MTVMTDVQVALYARVSSEQQVEANTIASQLSEMRARIAADGFDLQTVLEFVDAGSSGATLVRPALERLRDVCAMSPPLAGWIASMSIVLTASRATLRIKSCSGRS